MLCQECNQRQATLHFTKIINGQKNEMHLCEICAKEKGDSLPGSNSYSIHDLLSGLLNLDSTLGSSPSYQQRVEKKKALRCPTCGLSYQDFIKHSRFGCSHCYRAFDSKLDPILKRVHGGNHMHTGKIPKREGGRLQKKRELDSLRAQMQEHIAQEEFERAAEIRDRIRSLENSGEREDGG